MQSRTKKTWMWQPSTICLFPHCRAEPEFGGKGTKVIAQKKSSSANIEKSKTETNALPTGASSTKATGHFWKFVRLDGELFAGQNRWDIDWDEFCCSLEKCMFVLHTHQTFCEKRSACCAIFFGTPLNQPIILCCADNLKKQHLEWLILLNLM